MSCPIKKAEAEEQFAEAEREIAEAEVSYSEGLAEYEENLAKYNEENEKFLAEVEKADAEIADAEEKIAEAEDVIADLKGAGILRISAEMPILPIPNMGRTPSEWTISQKYFRFSFSLSPCWCLSLRWREW